MRKYLIVTLIFILLAGCSQEQKTADDVSLKPVSFKELSSFENDDMLTAYVAFQKGCAKIATQKGEFLGSAKIKVNRADYLAACKKAENILPAHFKDFIKQNFTPYRVIYQGEAQGKFTAYYESEINASYTPDEVYKYPVYGRPYDMIELDLSYFDSSLPNKKIVGRIIDNKLVPYYTRAEINQNGVNAPVILWADSYVDIYIMQIQGSAVAHMADGSKIRIAFAESNGRPFKGIGSILLSKGLIEAGQASMGKIKKWLKENTHLAVANMDENQRYIFHQLGDPQGPIGALGVPLTAGRSLAVDKSFVPLGSLLWLETSFPNSMPLNKLVLAQDIGGAIKGAVRGDYFWGSGGDDILEEAGKMNSQGQYFILIPNHTEKTDGQTR